MLHLKSNVQQESNRMKKTNGVAQLPIFPLPVVLIPEMTLPLHIFEPRYRLMLRHCMDGDRLFGVSYHPNAEVGRLAVPDPESIGCAARILHVRPRPDGRADILTVGTRRYRIGHYLSQDPYLLAEVEFFDDDPAEGDEHEAITALVARVVAYFSRFLRALQRLHDLPERSVALPENTERLSFIIAAAVLHQPEDLQRALEMVSTRARLEFLLTRLEKLTEDYEHRARSHAEARHNGQKRSRSYLH
jgi:Lon protease-like protein